MSRVARIFVRLFLVLIGYGIAALAASAFLHLVAWPFLALPGEEAPRELTDGLIFSVPLVGLFVSYFGFIPAAVLIGLSEIRGYRGWLYHGLSGGAGGFLALMIARRAHGPSSFREGASGVHHELPLIWMPEVATAAVAAGIIGGTVCWLVAGRTAGMPFRRTPRDNLAR